MLGLMTAPFSPVTTVMMTLLVNARLILRLTLLEPYGKVKRGKPYLIFSLTDETFSLVCGAPIPRDVTAEDYYLAVSALDQLYWVAGSVAGALLGQILPWDLTGIDFAMTALFTVIVVEQWEAADKSGLPGCRRICPRWRAFC